MIYPKDFPTKKINNQFTVSTSINNFGLKRFNQSLNSNGSNKSKSIDKENVWIRYCNNSTVHGLRYLAEAKVKASERLVWLVLISLALFGTLYVSHLLQVRYSTNKLATVVETTMYPVSMIPYPAVTICNSFLKNGTKESIRKLTEIIIALNGFEFASFEHFEHLVESDLSDLDNINVTELFLRIIHSCEEMFIEPCWWRSKYVQCCGENGLFVVQRSEYGICYAFNSVHNENGSARYLLEKDYPWRTKKFGDWGGIRANILVNDSTKIPHLQTKSGVLVMVHHPLTWPISANFIPVGTTTYIRMRPTFSYASKGVLELQPKERNCLLADEIHSKKYRTLPGAQYFFSNCICNCRRQYLISTCNCTVDFVYPSVDAQQCKLSDYKCLSQNNDLYNHEKPLPGNPFFSDEEKGMVCDCLPECEAVDYAFDVTPSIGSGNEDKDDNRVFLDVHFQRATLFKYRTDVVFDWIDLLGWKMKAIHKLRTQKANFRFLPFRVNKNVKRAFVIACVICEQPLVFFHLPFSHSNYTHFVFSKVGFGGIAGLFLGISLMSIAEVIFYFGIGVVNVLHEILHVNLK